MMSAWRLGSYRFAIDWRRRSAVTIATWRRYGKRWLRSKRISTGGYLSRPRFTARLTAEGRRRLGRLALRQTDRGATTERDLLKEQRYDNREGGHARSDKEHVVERRGERASDRQKDRRRDAGGRAPAEDGLSVPCVRGHRARELRRGGGRELPSQPLF